LTRVSGVLLCRARSRNRHYSRQVEHDRAWQNARVEEGLAEHPWLKASICKRLLMTSGIVLAMGAMGSGLGHAEGSGWMPWTLVLALFGLALVLPFWIAPRRFAGWMIRQGYPTDDALSRGDAAAQRNGIRTDKAVSGEREPYWPEPSKDP
jgi:hypothetical protein